MRTAALRCVFFTAAFASANANSDPASALGNFAKALKQVRSQSSTTPIHRCPARLSEMNGVSKSAVFSALEAPDLGESIVSRDGEVTVLMHYYLRSRSAPAKPNGQFPIVTFEIGAKNTVVAVTCMPTSAQQSVAADSREDAAPAER